MKSQPDLRALDGVQASARANLSEPTSFELLRRIEEGARRLASTITSSGETRLRDITLVTVGLEEITKCSGSVQERGCGWGQYGRDARQAD
jgi:hypothetical protein